MHRIIITIIILIIVVVVVVVVVIGSSSTPPSENITEQIVGHNYPPEALQSYDSFRAYITEFCEKTDNKRLMLNNAFGDTKCSSYYPCNFHQRVQCLPNLYFSYYHQTCVPYTQSDCFLNPDLYQ